MFNKIKFQDKNILLNNFLKKCAFYNKVLKLILFTHLTFGIRPKKKKKTCGAKGENGKICKAIYLEEEKEERGKKIG